MGADEVREQPRKHRAMNDPTRVPFVPTHRLQSAVLNRRFDRLADRNLRPRRF